MGERRGTLPRIRAPSQPVYGRFGWFASEWSLGIQPAKSIQAGSMQMISRESRKFTRMTGEKQRQIGLLGQTHHPVDRAFLKFYSRLSA
jgi:hypothetical protein